MLGTIVCWHPVEGKLDKFVIKTIGRCIYCLDDEGELSKEHLIPKGLLPRAYPAPWILLKASCEVCRGITSLFESAVLRGVWSPARGALNLSSYDPKKRPKSFPIWTERGGIEKRRMLRAKDSPRRGAISIVHGSSLPR
jgi:hypothetical protein